MTYVDEGGNIQSQPVTIDRTFEDTAPVGNKPLLDQPPLGKPGLDD
jgi:hypothetical protein